MNKYNRLVSFLFSLMNCAHERIASKKGNEKNQENLTLYGFSLVSLRFVGTQNFHALMKGSIGNSFNQRLRSRQKENSLFGCELSERIRLRAEE